MDTTPPKNKKRIKHQLLSLDADVKSMLRFLAIEYDTSMSEIVSRAVRAYYQTWLEQPEITILVKRSQSG